jgi:RES domain-containing protein
MERDLAVRVARGKTMTVEGEFERHVSPNVRSFTGSASGGRWGPAGAYPVIYLGRPRASVVVEAYRRLVDDVDGMTGDKVGPRRVLTANVHVTEILDLTDPDSRDEIGLATDDLEGPYEPCQRVGLAAHQLGLHGVLAPAATSLGETLALFERQLPAVELPVLVGEELLATLPPDPRVLRSADSRDAAGNA